MAASQLNDDTRTSCSPQDTDFPLFKQQSEQREREREKSEREREGGGKDKSNYMAQNAHKAFQPQNTLKRQND